MATPSSNIEAAVTPPDVIHCPSKLLPTRADAPEVVNEPVTLEELVPSTVVRNRKDDQERTKEETIQKTAIEHIELTTGDGMNDRSDCDLLETEIMMELSVIEDEEEDDEEEFHEAMEEEEEEEEEECC
ncbi:unnamed protein product [Peronospora farinosa]|uniref:Uncharacterized protein n=1 Tax=Peronospora farinosa TaxID=134698 RepID=A0AAV0TWW1_9STRA|nr:unnamed protein product [Peronospora farinosa]